LNLTIQLIKKGLGTNKPYVQLLEVFLSEFSPIGDFVFQKWEKWVFFFFFLDFLILDF